MARKRSIWRRSRDNNWYTTLHGKQVFVADGAMSYDDAWGAYCAQYTAAAPNKILVKSVFQKFLVWCRKNRVVATHKWYAGYIKSFSATISNGLSVSRLKKFQVQEWLDAEDEWSDTSKNAAVRAVRGALNWAVDLELIDANPLARFKAPSRSGRELVIDDSQFTRLLAFVGDEFADYLTFAYQTGARAQEIRILTAKHFDGEKFTLERKNSKGKKYRRVIYLNDFMLKLVTGLVKLNPDGPIFTNSAGKPWTGNAVRSRFIRRTKKKKLIGLAAKMGLPGLCATTLRHSFCTNCLLRGVDTTTVALLMGHRDVTMVAKVYQHLAKNHAYLLKAANQATATQSTPLVVIQVDYGIVPTVPALL